MSCSGPLAVDEPGAPPGHRAIVACSGLGGQLEDDGVSATEKKLAEPRTRSASSDFNMARRVYRTHSVPTAVSARVVDKYPSVLRSPVYGPASPPQYPS